MSNIKLSVKFGPVEIVFDGTEEFARNDLTDTIQRILSLDLPDAVDVSEEVASVVTPTNQASALLKSDSYKKLSTTDFAAKMGAKSGSDLLMAAAAALHHSKGQEDLRRSDLLNEMKGAKAFYRASYGSNLSKSLDMLVKSGRLQNPRSDTYALPYREIENTLRLV